MIKSFIYAKIHKFGCLPYFLSLPTMKESTFVKVFEDAAKNAFGDEIIVKRSSALLYELLLDQNLEVSVKDTKNPKRGYSAFQTDICIYERKNRIEYPRVVIEFKTKITSHDIITYSSKAGKHKLIYPGLRYGILASEIDFIPDRFFVHNENIDFFIAAKKYKTGDQLENLIQELVKTEIQASRTMEAINFGGEKFDYFRTDIVFGNFSST
ncbi:MAG TPA: hypothetical protein PLG85_08295 [Cyclobacteriaceae bacterium]|nr:hypothetical protein [Cyclobacteriaceae bacterium]